MLGCGQVGGRAEEGEGFLWVARGLGQYLEGSLGVACRVAEVLLLFDCCINLVGIVIPRFSGGLNRCL